MIRRTFLSILGALPAMKWWAKSEPTQCFVGIDLAGDEPSVEMVDIYMLCRDGSYRIVYEGPIDEPMAGRHYDPAGLETGQFHFLDMLPQAPEPA